MLSQVIADVIVIIEQPLNGSLKSSKSVEKELIEEMKNPIIIRSLLYHLIIQKKSCYTNRNLRFIYLAQI